MEPAGADDLLRSGRKALAAADWATARDCFEQAGDSAEALDGLSQSVHFEGDHARAIELKERAFVLYRRRGMATEAAEVARWLAFLHACANGNLAAARGWMARAESILEGVEESVTHGWITLDRAPFSRDAETREQLATSALAIARRFGDADLEFDALALLGEAHVAAGRVAEGMALLDQAMAAISAREVVGHGAVGEICCRLLSACEGAADVRRAEQWMSVVERLVVWRSFVRPTCRMHYGAILVALGRWAEAEHELLAAIRGFDSGYRAQRVLPLVRLADLRVRQGRFEEAERLLEGTEWHPTARRLAALIALARGDLALAEDLVGLCFEGTDSNDLACLPLFELLVGIKLSGDDLDGAQEALHHLARLAAESGNERALASAEFAAGRVHGAVEDERSAASHLKRALERFAALGLPLEAARAQLELARAVAPGASAAAIAEARHALRAFERLGALRDADEAAELLRVLGAHGRSWPKGHGKLTKRETEVLSLLAAGLSNNAISERLYISRRTTEHHVARILLKLGLRSRAEAAVYAVRGLPEDP